MGTYTYTAKVKYVAGTNGEFYINSRNLSEHEKKLAVLNDPVWAWETEIIDNIVDHGNDFELHGWVMNDSKHDSFGDIEACYWMKDGVKKVYVLNESQYGRVGYLCVTFFADDKSTLEEFLKDHVIETCPIEADAIVQWTV